MNLSSVMELDQGAHMDLGHGAGLVTSAGATERTELEREGDGIVNEKGADGEFSSGSSSSNASLHSCSTLAPISPSSPTVCAEEDKEMLTGCSKSFTGLKIFTRRKAIAKSGLHHLPCQPSTSSLNRTDPEASIRSTVDWTESAMYGDHIWFETNGSGDSCYVGEQHCIARALQKSISRRKCAACKIVAHTICIEQLEKINFRCKPSFRDSGSRNIRERL